MRKSEGPKKPTMTKTKNKMKIFTPELAEFIGKKVATRAQAFKIVFAYVKERNLQDPDDKKFFLPDKKMSKIFGTERIHIFGIHPCLTAHIKN
jgi:upstream activation factor subunit UAF30